MQHMISAPHAFPAIPMLALAQSEAAPPFTAQPTAAKP